MRYIIFTILIFISYSIVCQNIPQFRKYNGNGAYGEVEVFPVKGIASDYGTRNIDDHWHGGIDYNSSMNDGNNDR